MAKYSKPPEETPPDLSLAQGKIALTKMKEQGVQMLSARPVEKERFEAWETTAERYIKRIFGSMSDHLTSFYGGHSPQVITADYQTTEGYMEPRRYKALQAAVNALQAMLEQIDLEISIESPEQARTGVSDDQLWPMLHPDVARVSRKLFEDGHYAEAAEAAFKEFNDTVKNVVKGLVSPAEDGVSLMRAAFNVGKNPSLITLDDVSSPTGANIQEGYTHMFAGAMMGIRNPKAHHNITITRARGIEFLFVASLFFNKLSERKSP
jgi:uncharacterized protein (TIGR02391 family)